jgi:hypothetical protein
VGCLASGLGRYVAWHIARPLRRALSSVLPRGESGAYGVAEQLALDVAGSASGKGFWTG